MRAVTEVSLVPERFAPGCAAVRIGRGTRACETPLSLRGS